MSFVRSVVFLSFLIAGTLVTGTWSCKSPARRNPADITYENGAGKSRTVKLPDGSSVAMSARTVIRISQKFGQTERDLELDGEAIFTVNGDAGKPFIVHTRNLQIQVLGTLFKVDAYASNAGEEVDVLSGKLKVTKSYHSDTDNEPEIIGPGEMVMINRDIDLMEKEKLDSAEWKTLREKVQAMGTPLGADSPVRDSSGSAVGTPGSK
ncbi:MAG TPA: FecR domain-containing protein [Puia sp.]|nr:FecR domain-containing protein [Puia sp.]